MYSSGDRRRRNGDSPGDETPRNPHHILQTDQITGYQPQSETGAQYVERKRQEYEALYAEQNPNGSDRTGWGLTTAIKDLQRNDPQKFLEYMSERAQQLSARAYLDPPGGYQSSSDTSLTHDQGTHQYPPDGRPGQSFFGSDQLSSPNLGDPYRDPYNEAAFAALANIQGPSQIAMGRSDNIAES